MSSAYKKRPVLTSGGNSMTGLEALQSVQYATVKGKRFAVINVNDWEALLEWLETLEDVQIARQAFAELKAFGGNRERAGWLRWDEVKEELV
jgi:hypothetical protein